jgi:hypothetical protein
MPLVRVLAVLLVLAVAWPAAVPAAAKKGERAVVKAECAKKAKKAKKATRAQRTKHARRCVRRTMRRRAAARRRRAVRAPSASAPSTAGAEAGAALPVAAASGPPAGAASSRLFAPDSFWNAPLGADAPLDARSATYVGELRRQLTLWLPWINTTQHSVPVHTVPAGQPTVPVTLDKTSNDPQTAALREAFRAVPIPPDAVPAAGVDKNLVVHQPSTDSMWEFWGLEKRADGWHAKWGGKMTDVSTNPGHYAAPTERWGATATSLPLLGGLMRTEELRAGRIDHALAIALPEIRSDIYSWPAQRTDGQVAGEDAIPEGTRFRLPANLDLSTIPMSPVIRAMAEAAQRYGIVVRDRAGAVAFYAEAPTGADPYPSLFGGKLPSALLAQFPWAHLQTLRADLRRDPL